jgi:hypothetical protein
MVVKMRTLAAAVRGQKKPAAAAPTTAESDQE